MATMEGRRRGETLDLIDTLVTERCGVCSVMFALPKAMRDACRADHSRVLYCPNGHNLTYQGKTTSELAAEEQRARAEQAERELVVAREQRDREAAEAQRQRKHREKAERSARAIKAHRDRVLRLIGTGVCPVGRCGLDLGAAVHEHLATVHPKFRAHQVVEALREEVGS